MEWSEEEEWDQGPGCGAPREGYEVIGHRCRGCSGQWDVSFTWEERSVSEEGAALGGVLRTGGAAAGTGVPVVMATAQCGPPPSPPPAPEAPGSRRRAAELDGQKRCAGAFSPCRWLAESQPREKWGPGEGLGL